MERAIESRLKFYFRLRIIALRNCWMSIEFLNGIQSVHISIICIYYVLGIVKNNEPTISSKF